MPFTVWATGTTVTAADFNTFLQQQVLTTWADLTALNAGIASPTEGMFAFTKDNDTLYYRSASAWVATSLAADITEVATPASGGLVGGGTSGAISLKIDTDNKGDLVVGTGADATTKLPVAANTYVLSADSSTTSGLAWVAPSTGDITSIVTSTNSSMAGGTLGGDADISVSVTNSTTATAASGDFVLIADTSASNGTRKALVSDVVSLGLASPTFTGVASAATASAGTSTTQLSTTKFVTDALAASPSISILQVQVFS